MANSKRRHWTVIGAAAAAVVVAAGIATAVSGGDPGQPRAFGRAPAAAAAPTGTTSGKPSPDSPGPVSTSAPASSSSPTRPPNNMKWGLDYSDTLTFDTTKQLATALDDAKRLGSANDF